MNKINHSRQGVSAKFLTVFASILFSTFIYCLPCGAVPYIITGRWGAPPAVDGEGNPYTEIIILHQLYVDNTTITLPVTASGMGQENFGALRLDNSTLTGTYTVDGDTGIGTHTGAAVLQGALFSNDPSYTVTLRRGTVKIDPAAGVNNSNFDAKWILMAASETGHLITTNTATTGTAGVDQVLGKGGIVLQGGNLITESGVARTLFSNVEVYSGGFQTNSNLTYYGELSGTGTLTKTGGAALYVTADQSGYAGNWNIAQGTMVVDKANTTEIFGTGMITLSGGTLNVTADNAVFSNKMAASSAGSGKIEAGNNNLTFTGEITGAGTLEFNGSATTTFTGANTMAGKMNILGGTAVLTGDNRGNSNVTWNINAGALLEVNTGNATMEFGGLSGTGTLTRSADGGEGTQVFQVGSGTLSVKIEELAVGTHKIAVEKVGTGVLTVDNNQSSYTGGTTVSGGTLHFTGAGDLAGQIAFAAGTTLQFSNQTAEVQRSKYDLAAGTSIKAGTGAAVTIKDSFSLKNLVAEGAVGVDTGSTVTVSGMYTQGTKHFTMTSGGEMIFAGGTANGNLAERADITLNGGTLKLSADISLPDYAGLAVRFDASSADNFSLNADNSINVWYDTSGNGNNGTANNTGAVLVPGVLGGNSVVRFPTNSQTGFGFSRVNTIQTVFWVAKDNPGNENFLLGDSVTWHFHRGDNNGSSRNMWSGNTHINVRNGTTMLNGVNVNGTTTPLTLGWDLISVQTDGNVEANNLSYDRGLGRSWDGDMAEVLIFTSALTNDQVGEINRYLNTKWNLGLDLEPYVVDTFDASGSSLTLAADSTLDVSAFDTAKFGGIHVGDKQLNLLTNAGGTTLYANVAMGKDGKIVMNSGETQHIVGDMTAGGIFDGSLALEGTLFFDLSDIASLTGALMTVTGDMDFTNTVIDIDFSSIPSGYELPAGGVTLLDVLGDVTNFPSLDGFPLPDGWTWGGAPGSGLIQLLGGENAATPEPATWMLLLAGGAGVMFLRRKRVA